MTGGHDLWVTGLGVLVHLGDFGTMQGHEVLGREIQPHSPHGQPGLPGRVEAGVIGTIVAVGFTPIKDLVGDFLCPVAGSG